MTVSQDDVIYLSKLCKIKLTDEEIVALSNELGNVFEWMEHVSDVDLGDGIKGSESCEGTLLREDEVLKKCEAEDLLLCSPGNRMGYFSVPIAIESK